MGEFEKQRHTAFHAPALWSHASVWEMVIKEGKHYARAHTQLYLFDIVACLCTCFNKQNIHLFCSLLSLLCGYLSAMSNKPPHTHTHPEEHTSHNHTHKNRGEERTQVVVIWKWIDEPCPFPLPPPLLKPFGSSFTMSNLRTTTLKSSYWGRPKGFTPDCTSSHLQNQTVAWLPLWAKFIQTSLIYLLR